MSHIIHAILLKGAYHIDEATKYELIPVELDFDLTMFFIDDDYTTYWQKKLGIIGSLESNSRQSAVKPDAMVIYELMKRITQRKPIHYAVIMTAYVGGMGDQFANVYQDDQNADRTVHSINDALKLLGVQKKEDDDEFDTVGLGRFRSNPDYLMKYHDMLRHE